MMLTNEVLRVRRRGNSIRPLYVSPLAEDIVERANDLIALFDAHVGRSVAQLNARARELEGCDTDFKLMRGLRQVLQRKLRLASFQSPIAPEELRQRLFLAAAQRHPVDAESRVELLEELATSLGCSVHNLEDALFSDLKEAQRIEAFEVISADALVHRYNLALAQSLLRKAKRLDITLTVGGELAAAAFRLFFQRLKFFQLLYDFVIVSREAERITYRFTLDGPFSVLRNTQKYGKKLADFLPSIVANELWSAQAEVIFEDREFVFELSHTDGLQSAVRDRGVYLSETHQLFAERFEALGPEAGWTLEPNAELLVLSGQHVWVPDYRLVRDDGALVYLEIVGHWRSDYLQRRMEILAKYGPPNLLLALSDRLKVDDQEVAALPVPTLRFKSVLRTKQVLELLDTIAPKYSSP